MKTSTSRERLLRMDVKMSFPFSLKASVRILEVGEVKVLEYDVQPGIDLHEFIYDLINPFRHPQDWPVNGDNYLSTVYSRKHDELMPETGKNFSAFKVTHSMKKGLILDAHPVIKSYQRKGTF